MRRQRVSRYSRVPLCKRRAEDQESDLIYVVSLAISFHCEDFAILADVQRETAKDCGVELLCVFADLSTHVLISQFIAPDHATCLRVEREAWAMVPQSGVLIARVPRA